MARYCTALYCTVLYCTVLYCTAQVSPLQLCGLESIARHHPASTLTLLALAPASALVSALQARHPNLRVQQLSLPALFPPASPLHQLWASGRVAASRWPVSHTSDLVRSSK